MGKESKTEREIDCESGFVHMMWIAGVENKRITW